MTILVRLVGHIRSGVANRTVFKTDVHAIYRSMR
jgi:hypothetical protein